MLSHYDIKNILRGKNANATPVDDFRVIDSYTLYEENNGKKALDRKLEYLCYEIESINPETGEKLHFFKALKFVRVIRLPKSAKQSTSLMDMQQDVLTSAYQNGYNLITIIANVIRPVPLGLLFLYGVQGVGNTIEEAKEIAHDNFIGFINAMQGTFRVLEMRIINAQETEWLREKMYNMNYMTVVKGIPEASSTGEDVGNKGAGGKNLNPNSQGTLEEFIAGMTDYEYVVQILATPVFHSTLRDWHLETTKHMSDWNSQLQGTKALSFNISMPMMMMANQSSSQGWSKAYTDADTISSSVGESFSTGYGESVSESLSRSYSESFGINQSQSITESTSVSQSISNGQTFGQTLGQSIGENATTNVNVGESMNLSQGQSINQSISSNVSNTQGVTSGQSYGQNFSENVNLTHSVGANQSFGQTLGESIGQTNTASTSQNSSHGMSHSFSNGWNNSNSLGFTKSEGISENLTENTSDGYGTNENVGVNSGKSYGEGAGVGGNLSGSIFGFGGGVNASGTKNNGESNAINSSFGSNQSHSNSVGTSIGNSENISNSHSSTSGTSGGVSVSENSSLTQGSSLSEALSNTKSSSQSNTFGSSESYSEGNGFSQGQSFGLSESISNSQSLSNGLSNGWGESISKSNGITSSQGYSQGVNMTNSLSSSQSISRNESTGITTGKSVGVTQGESYTQGVSEGTSNGYSVSQNVSQGINKSQSNGESHSVSNGTSGAYVSGMSSSMGFGPSIGYNKSYQWLDHQVKDILEMLEYKNERIKKAIRGEGAFYTYVYIACPSRDALAAAQAVAKSTWQNEFAMIQPLQVLKLSSEEQKHLLYHFSAFSNDITRESIAGSLQYKYCTPLLPHELVAYTHLPRISAGGIFADVNDIPKFAVPSLLKGEIYMGTILSAETYTILNGYSTPFDYRIDESELMHGFFTGSSRSGKTVAAMRFVAELANVRRKDTGKRLRIVCMDPKQDWRTLARFIDPERFRFHSLGNAAFRPVYINPFKIPRGVVPQTWIDGVIDIYCRAYGLLERGKQMLGETIYALYKEAGVFKACERDDWKDVVPKLSGYVTFPKVYKKMMELKVRLEDPSNPKGRAGNDTRDAYTRLIDRLQCFAPDRDFSIEYKLFGTEKGIGIDELIGDDDVTILESSGLEKTFKNFIFGVITSGFYKYAKAHEGGYLAHDQYETVLVIEEANEVLIGNDCAGSGAGSSVGMTVSGQSEFEEILDQSAGYGLFIIAITQKISNMPKSIVANSGLVFAGRLIPPDDINVVVRSVAREERYDDRDLVKWFPRMATGMFVCRRARTFDFKDAEPILVQIARLNAVPPSNLEIDEILTQQRAMRQQKSA